MKLKPVNQSTFFKPADPHKKQEQEGYHVSKVKDRSVF